MSLALFAYRMAMTGLTPFVPLFLSRRCAAGKEDPARLHERRAMDLPSRPSGRLIWCHGASVGESLMLHALMDRVVARSGPASVLYTSQTRSAADLIGKRLRAGERHQYAPIDTPGAASRFLDHWTPDLGLFGEGEIWPHLLLGARKRDIPLALINARSTEGSIKGWSRVKGAARTVYAAFETIVAADESTAQGLSQLLDRPISTPGNLKAALPPPLPAGDIPEALEKADTVLLAASTHAGEETLIHGAWRTLPDPRPALVIAPRHPERAAAIREDIEAAGSTVKQRSLGEIPGDRDVYLADTLGEMGLWYAHADLVYLGGGHANGVGGHNPMEPLRLGKPVITGPSLFNFDTVAPALAATGGLVIADTGEDLTTRLATHLSGAQPIAIDEPAIAAFFAEADTPMAVTLDAIDALLSRGDTP